MGNQGFPIGFDQWADGTFQAKWPKTALKLQNQHFQSKTVEKEGGGLGNKPFFWLVAGFPQSPATRGNPGNHGQTMVNIVYPPFMFRDHVDHGKKSMVQFRMINFKTLQEHGKGGLYAN